MYLIETSHSVVPIEDLGITVTNRVPVWMTEEQYEVSDCTQRLERIGKIRVSRRNRSRQTKDPVPPGAGSSRPRSQIARLSRPRKVALAPTPEATFSKQEVEVLVSQAARDAAERVARAVSENLPVPLTPTRVPEDLEERLERVVEKALSGLSNSAPNRASGGVAPTESVSRGPRDPLFIPEGIVQKSDGVELTVQTESSEGGGLDEASAVLKALRKKQKRERETR